MSEGSYRDEDACISRASLVVIYYFDEIWHSKKILQGFQHFRLSYHRHAVRLAIDAQIGGLHLSKEGKTAKKKKSVVAETSYAKDDSGHISGDMEVGKGS